MRAVGTRHRQEVLNVVLADLLNARGLVSSPETIHHDAGDAGRRHMPDVLVRFRGLRLMLEGELDQGGGSEDRALASARRRVEAGLAHIGVGVVYPRDLEREPYRTLSTRLATSTLRVAVVTEARDHAYVPVNVDGLAGILSRVFDELLQEDAVERAVAALDAGVDRFEAAIEGSATVARRLAVTLGIRELGQREAAPTGDEEGE